MRHDRQSAAVTSQIEGATAMELGGAMFEAIRFTDGVITNAAFSAYRVPRLADIPPVEVILLNRPICRRPARERRR